jgi:hypothetical protein
LKETKIGPGQVSASSKLLRFLSIEKFSTVVNGYYQNTLRVNDNQMKRLNDNQMKRLNYNQMKRLNYNQIKRLNYNQIKRLNNNQFNLQCPEIYLHEL